MTTLASTEYFQLSLAKIDVGWTKAQRLRSFLLGTLRFAQPTRCAAWASPYAFGHARSSDDPVRGGLDKGVEKG